MKRLRKFDAAMVKFVQERPQAWRRLNNGLYGTLLAWHLWDVVHRNHWWGIDYAVAIFLAVLWGFLAFMWGRQDRCEEIRHWVTESLGDSDAGALAWKWAYLATASEQREILHWMRTHNMAAVHVDDMPRAVRDLAYVVAAHRL